MVNKKHGIIMGKEKTIQIKLIICCMVLDVIIIKLKTKDGKNKALKKRMTLFNSGMEHFKMGCGSRVLVYLIHFMDPNWD